jgi:IS5 family transposase
MLNMQPSLTDAEYGLRRRVTRREEFLTMMDQVIPWDEWAGLVRPFYYDGRKGRKPVRLETMLRMYLLQAWFSLSDEAVEDQVNDSYAFRAFMRLDFSVEQVPDATTLLHFRHLMEAHDLGKALFDAQSRFFAEHGWIMRGGTVVDATIIAAPSSTKNAARARDPQMRQTRKGNQWYFGMKAHVGVDAGTGYVHTVAVTSANAADVAQTSRLLREDDRVVWADAGYTGVEKRDEIAGDPRWSAVEYRVAAKRGVRARMAGFDQRLQSRQAGIRSTVEHVFLVVKRDFGFAKTRYRGLAKNTERLFLLFASANLLMRARAVRLAG